MEKLEVIRTNRGYVKYYRLEQIIAPEAFLEALKQKGWTFDRVFLRRDAEMDMQSDIGFYAPEELPGEPGGLPCQYTVTAQRDGRQAEIHFSDDADIVYLVTKDENLELE